mmetsp:Transcript_9594/g.27684  ORF Transcript_9594/g.27684 Transcript_9594/m.27684 type:complete len:268 (+) Transcript_9594:1562-2365(+)
MMCVYVCNGTNKSMKASREGGSRQQAAPESRLFVNKYHPPARLPCEVWARTQWVCVRAVGKNDSIGERQQPLCRTPIDVVPLSLSLLCVCAPRRHTVRQQVNVRVGVFARSTHVVRPYRSRRQKRLPAVCRGAGPVKQATCTPRATWPADVCPGHPTVTIQRTTHTDTHTHTHEHTHDTDRQIDTQNPCLLRGVDAWMDGWMHLLLPLYTRLPALGGYLLSLPTRKCAISLHGRLSLGNPLHPSDVALDPLVVSCQPGVNPSLRGDS